uniref:Uncharacterized protein n=1 Tax=Setaria italica TaxID=4555 RepID=K4AHR0_SETIT
MHQHLLVMGSLLKQTHMQLWACGDEEGDEGRHVLLVSQCQLNSAGCSLGSNALLRCWIIWRIMAAT